jgi:hypothetical protein
MATAAVVGEATSTQAPLPPECEDLVHAWVFPSWIAMIAPSFLPSGAALTRQTLLTNITQGRGYYLQ